MAGAKKKSIKFLAKGKLREKLDHKNLKKRKRNSQHHKSEKLKFQGRDNQHSKGVKVSREAPNEKTQPDMMDEMDVDEFLDGGFLTSDSEKDGNSDDDAIIDEDASEFDEMDEGLDDRYLVGLPEEEQISMQSGEVKLSRRSPKNGESKETQELEDSEENEEEVADNEMEVSEKGVVNFGMEELLAIEKECFEDKSFKALQKLIKVFSNTCRSKDIKDTNQENSVVYQVDSSAVYDRLMLNVLQKTHVVFSGLVSAPQKNSQGEQTNEEEEAQELKHEKTNEGAQEPKQKIKLDERKWKKYNPLLMKFFHCLIYLLEETCDQQIQAFVLQQLAHYLPFLVPSNKLQRRILKVLLKIWAKSTEDHQLCLLAFVRIRELAIQIPFPFLELCLKALYLTYMRNTKFTHEMNFTHQILMGNCVVELYGLDLVSSYHHAFIYIRQLAIAIRKTVISPSTDSFRAVLNWQFVNQLRVWTAVISAYPQEDQLQQLIYPLCQLIHATVRLASTIRFAPLRFHCVRMLQQLALSSETFVPTSSILLEILDMPPFNSSYSGKRKSTRAKASGTKNDKNNTSNVDLDLCIKVSKSAMESKQIHDLIISKLFELFHREVDIYKYEIGFPELTIPWGMILKKYAQACKVARWKTLAKGVCDSIAKQAAWVREKRSNVEFAPKDVKECQHFLRQEKDQLRSKLLANDVQVLQNRVAEEIQQVKKSKQSDVIDTIEQSTDNNTNKERESQEDDTLDTDKLVFKKVKNMSMKEFKESVANVDEEDKVDDFVWSDEEGT
uniref:Nucleolar complex protein putative n=1 Tax=Albugo laibachii Nc14 TaxID=890382 RepID=F0WMP8_9STRA|nr:nucleolar complex protein putative [Albugo laibachii Nc14]|eukprot:CCA22582.1 nucleolar complex protein putative [Albugo laibachii Nc14]